ncbi:MAG: integrase core domain-containing protein [Bacteroidales bacterium]
MLERNIRISMTQSGDPLHNALAERMNNTLKNSWMFDNSELTLGQARIAIDRAVLLYNTARPHQALGMRTPMQLVDKNAYNPLLASGF